MKCPEFKLLGINLIDGLNLITGNFDDSKHIAQ